MRSDAAGIGALSGSLSHLASLTALDVSGNPFGDAGCTAFASALDHLPRLTNLSLSYAKLTENGVTISIPILSKLHQLRSLRILYGNDQTPASFTALRAAVPACCEMPWY